MSESPEYEKIETQELQDSATVEETYDAQEASEGRMPLGFDDPSRHAN
ncbi:hypothetical protein [Ktedonospora formicarum]|uniref:Uncharacterized protein n=1 Tax=Ktedonospora formicarum TaxID=2778364 RepID=A0A8J3I668_9CHLR|nr:hypothetical protein [Ktedonospora formicarum]GHO47202.1 hypothetical protein KSX_53650 [Ktedonospora formicarum]GHO50309.1 hypothetical protein KSX_84720 [Ktedonospora formicarum]